MKSIKMTREKPKKWTTRKVFHINWKLFGLFGLPVGLLVTIQATLNGHTWKLPNNENLKYSNITSIWVYWIYSLSQFSVAPEEVLSLLQCFLFVFSKFVCEFSLWKCCRPNGNLNIYTDPSRYVYYIWVKQTLMAISFGYCFRPNRNRIEFLNTFSLSHW